MENNIKICKACKEEKPLSEFYLRNDTGKHKNRCKRCCIDGINTVRSSTHKLCKHCNIEKPFANFQKAGGGKWLQPYCKDCDKLRKKVWEVNNKPILKVKRHKYYKEVAKSKYVPHPKILKTKEEIRERNRMYRNLPYVKAKTAEANKRYRLDNPEKVKERKKAYYNLKGNEQAKAWQKKQMNNPEFKIKKNLRSRVYVALKRGIKTATTMQLLGCSIEEFKIHIESQFKDGMGWHNYRKDVWHLDHIKPCKLFDLTKESEQNECFHFSNMQPLWSIDNLIKGTKYE